MEKDNLSKNLTEIFEASYVISLYQRNFEWRREQISRLLQDIYQAYRLNPAGNYFIGSLVVKARGDEYFEVIDGQQRLTTLSLIGSYIGLSKHNRLLYDSRPHVVEFLNTLFDRGDVAPLDHPSVRYLKDGLDTINNVELTEGMETHEVVKFVDEVDKKDSPFIKYLVNNVILLRVEVPDDTDVAAYFEIMNNRGAQLQEHEIVKAALASRIVEANGNADANRQHEFAVIWDACSQIDDQIQRLFDANTRRKYFGNNYDQYLFTGLSSDNSIKAAHVYTIDQVLDMDLAYDRPRNDTDNKDDKGEGQKYFSIIDFPNFLMHVLRAFYNDAYQQVEGPNANIPLDATHLLRVYNTISEHIDPQVFIAQLLRSRVFFDRYVVKTVSAEGLGDDDDDGMRWVLGRPYLYDNKTLKYNNTFGDQHQDRAIKALSMLQVAFRNRKNKDWLQETIRWFNDQPSLQVNPDEYIRHLDSYATERFEKYEFVNLLMDDIGDRDVTRDNSLSLGVDTPHFLFYYIDYLYWVEKRTGCRHDICHSEKIKDFSFKYWNSVEHHLAREKAKAIDGYDNFIDCLGNLCLISRSANSRLNDRLVAEKVNFYRGKNMGPNRQIMYLTTTWDKSMIRSHYRDLVRLLASRRPILGLE